MHLTYLAPTKTKWIKSECTRKKDSKNKYSFFGNYQK